LGCAGENRTKLGLRERNAQGHECHLTQQRPPRAGKRAGSHFFVYRRHVPFADSIHLT
jgi:hypothetical protein